MPEDFIENHHAPRLVTGFHGCTREAAETICAEETFLLSTKAFDWLGDGFYFWEYGPSRAKEWAESICARRKGSEPAVIRAILRLGKCLNLLDTEHSVRISSFYVVVVKFYEAQGRDLPKNTQTGGHFLDRQILNMYCKWNEEETGVPFQTVRGCFPEGEPIFENSKILGKTHVQIAVRDAACIPDLSIL